AVWIIPIVAALVGIGIAVQRYLSEGPEIRITFQAGEGIEAGKTAVKYKDIEIGKVTKLSLTSDRSKILVIAEMEKSTEDMLDNDARFWIVKPRVTMSGISGIGALISGNYIGFEPGRSAVKQRDFVGLEAPPPVKRDRPGKEFVLRSGTLGSLGLGSPVYYRRLAVGEVVAYDLAKGGQSVEIRVFVNAPYDKYVTPDTRFWEASGLDVSAGADGLTVRTESVAALLVGGIVFETPFSGQPSGVPPDTVFTLFKERKEALAPTVAQVQRFALNFRETLHGLSVGAPVQFLGLPVGEVSYVGLEYDPRTKEIRPNVEISIFQYRFDEYIGAGARFMPETRVRENRREVMRKLVEEKGLRAQLRTGSLISGQLYVGLDYFPGAPKARIDWKKDPPVFPVVVGAATDIQEKIQSIAAKLDKVPIDEIGEDVRKAVESLDGTLKSATRTLERMEGETLPEAKRALEELRRTAGSAERLLSNADNTLLGPDASAQRELRDALREFTRAAQAIRVLADYLERNPEALIRGKHKEGP
ncbi:MAG: Mammalian cell entry related domain protein, partial [Deltaproteobacteria bacterium]|nr:Mammalian cell entry related domain protein [Deltaproteobacteria bacterium]